MPVIHDIMITALIFDFDGLLVDTETPAFESWQSIYTEYGHTLSLDLWKEALGTSHGFDPLAHLATLAGKPIDRDGLWARRVASKEQLAALQPLLPGAQTILDQVRALGLACALASSSDRMWIDRWLSLHNISDCFSCVRTADDVVRTKPSPELFLSAAACLGVPPSACLVFEDSPNGILAARAAGMRCVAVPGAITRQLELPPADLVIESLDALPLARILELLT
jgi:HAD superfamily hydrolase (TIGR01509 family)